MANARSLLHCRLCRRVALAVFLAILAIEAAILIPSYVNYERDRLEGIAQAGLEVSRSALAVAQSRDPEEIDEVARQLAPLPESSSVLGGRLHPADMTETEPMLAFGDAPATEIPTDATLRSQRARAPDGEWMDLHFDSEQLGQPFQLTLRLDTSEVGPALTAFVIRIAGLVLLIAVFVTGATLLVLQWLLLHPILGLRSRMAEASSHPESPGHFAADTSRRDELGDLTRSFNELLRSSQRNLDAVAERESELRTLNAELDARVAERTRELDARNQALEQEIEQRRRAEAEVRSLARFPDENTNPVLRVDPDGEILYHNAASLPLLTHWGAKEANRLPPEWARAARNALSTHEPQHHELQCADCWFSIALTPIPEEGYINLYATDITERKAYEDALLHRQTHDELTDLPNLAVFQDRLHQAIRSATGRGARGAAVVIGLDGFREINGVAGHEAGDAVLQAVAERLTQAVGAHRTVGRLGGDEFGVLITDVTDFNALASLAESCIDAVTPPLHWKNRELAWGASAGIALYPDDGAEAGEVLRNAELALSGAKGRATEKFRFYIADMNAAVEYRNRRLNELRHALEQDEFELHYQPQVHAHDGSLSGHEALIRWRRPEEGLISPGEFIPLAEESGLISPLGQWTFRAALAQAARWKDQGRALRVAVNLSAVQLGDPTLPEQIGQLLEETGVEPALLELEVTESAVMEDLDTAMAILQRLRALGIQLALDDFGTGFSSLAYLKRLPVDRVKIDRAFVRALPDDTQDRAFCEAIIRLSDSLGLYTLAEGVETPEQARVLAELGCHELQGFLYGRPAPAT